MRILFVTSRFGSGSFVSEAVTDALARSGHDVHLFASIGPDATTGSTAAGAGPAHVVTPRRPTSFGRIAVLLRAIGVSIGTGPWRMVRLVGRVARRHGIGPRAFRSLYAQVPVLAARPDVVHFSALNLMRRCEEVLSLVAAPVVVTCHGSDLRLAPHASASARRSTEALLRRADLVQCVSGELGGHAQALGVAPERVLIGRWGVDTAFFSPAPTTGREERPVGSDRLQIVSVGRLHPVKGYDLALRAVRDVLDAGVDVEYQILGDDRGALGGVRRTLSELGLEEHVRLVGAVGRSEVLDALRAADVFLLSSLSEGRSRAALEAMAVGLPVVVTEVGGMPEVVDDGVQGFVVPAGDPLAIAKALLELARSPQLRAQMGAAARHRACQELDLVGGAAELAASYGRLRDRWTREQAAR